MTRPRPAREPGDARPSRPATEPAEPAYLYLTTVGRRTGQPREIEIWFTRHEGRDYLLAEHGERAAWVRNLMAGPRVTWRIGEDRFTGRARVVDAAGEPALRRTIQALSSRKYGWGDGLVVELAPDPESAR